MSTDDLNHATPSVRFDIRLPGLGLQSEAQLARLAPTGLSLEDLSGRLHLAMGAHDVMVQDDLGSLATQVMLGAIPSLRAGQPYETLLYTSPGSAKFDPQADGQVLLTVDGEALGSYPSAALAEAFLDCARRIGRAVAARAPDDAAVQSAANALLDRASVLALG